MKISFVIPCYRSEKTLEGVVSELRAVVAHRPDVAYEIVLVSDHSPDGVWGVIARLAADDPAHVRGLELARNFGQHAALMAGYARTSGDVVFSLDDDGQAPVESVWELVDALERQQADVVYGEYPEKRHNAFRNGASALNQRILSWLFGASDTRVKITSFFAARRFVIDTLLAYTGPYPCLGGLVLRTTRNLAYVPVRHRARAEGASGYTLRKLFGLWLNGFTAFSVKPLRLASWLGFACATAGFLFGVWVVLRKFFFAPAVPAGYSSLMAALFFIGGMLMLLLGLIGEYVGRIYICINRAPQYVVARETRPSPRSAEEGE